MAAAAYRSPFVARLVANAMLDGVVRSMRAAGIAVSPHTLDALQDLRTQINGRVRQADADTALGPPGSTLGNAGALLSELDTLIDRLDELQDALPCDPDAARSADDPGA